MNPAQKAHRIALVLLLGLTLLPATSLAKGGDGEGAFCLFTPERDTYGACLPGFREFTPCTAGDCGPGGCPEACGCSSSRCFAVTPCGGLGQRACCSGEAGFGACLPDSGGIPLQQVNLTPSCPQSFGGCICGGDNPSHLTKSNTTCIAQQPCGGVGQRACCPGEVTGFPCPNSDFVREVDGCDNCFCGPDAIAPGIAAISSCQAVAPCGGEGQRACCVTEYDHLERKSGCDLGLVEAPGCDEGFGDCTCGGTLRTDVSFKSTGTCVRVEPCGGEGQRGCCVGEGGRNLPSDLACDKDLVEVLGGCTGNCYCGGDPLGAGTLSSSMCINPDKPVEEPATDCVAGEPGCPLRGYADLHVHMFGSSCARRNGLRRRAFRSRRRRIRRLAAGCLDTSRKSLGCARG